MSNLDLIRSVFAHNEWANNRVLDAAADAQEDSLKQQFGGTSLKAILLHILGSHVSWLAKWTGEMPPLARVEPGREIAAIRESYNNTHERLRSYIASLDEEGLQKVTELFDPDENGQWRTWQRPAWQMMLSTGGHAMQHRGEAALILTALGHSPGEIDYSYWCWRTKSE
jgi:uncharacterized damage-inducible protein DinB